MNSLRRLCAVPLPRSSSLLAPSSSSSSSSSSCTPLRFFVTAPQLRADAKKDAKGKDAGAKKGGGGSKAGKPTAASACKIPAGTTLPDLTTVCRGANYMEGGKDPVLKPDSEYPPWLFTLLDPRPAPEGVVPRRQRKAAIRLRNISSSEA